MSRVRGSRRGGHCVTQLTPLKQMLFWKKVFEQWSIELRKWTSTDIELEVKCKGVVQGELQGCMEVEAEVMAEDTIWYNLMQKVGGLRKI